MTRAKTSFVKAGLIGLALCSSAAAFAQDNLPPPITGCLPTTEMMARLQAEGQKSILVGNRMRLLDHENDRFVNERYMNVMTMNEDGSRGYNLEANAAIGKPATQYCVAGTFNNVRLHDVSSPVLPAELQGNRNAEKTYGNGIGVMATARTARGALVIWDGSPANNRGALSVLGSAERGQILAIMTDVSYRPYAVERLNRSRQLASLQSGGPAVSNR